MSTLIKIVCFDINSDYEEDFNKSIGENISALENPMRILNEFQEIHLFLESEKIRKSSSEVKYTFKINLSEKTEIIIEFVVLNDLSFIHDASLDADAYLVFTNLEKENTTEQLEKIIKYILESCSLKIKTYLVGIYRENNLPSLNKESLESYFKEENLIYEYYQLKYMKDNNKEENDEFNHDCIYNHKYKIINIKEKGISEKERKNNAKKNESNNFFDIIEMILIQIYESKMNVELEIEENNDTLKLNEKERNFNSESNCLII